MSETHRSQTEPLAALFAVAAVAIGITFYATYIGGVLPGSSEDAVEEPTIESVWNDVEEHGLYKSTDNPWNDEGGDGVYIDTESPLDNISESSLPRGTTVYIEVTTVEENARPVTLDRIIYDGSAAKVEPGPDEPPDHGHNATRPIPVRVRPGDVTAGTLRVVTW